MNFNESIILENERVRLEPLSVNHLTSLLPIALKYPDLLQFSPSPFGSEESLKQNIEDSLAERANEQRYPFAIFDKLNGHFVGSTSYGNISLANQRLEIGWTWIDKAVQGTGLNKQCKHLLLAYAFSTLAIERVEFRTDERNLQSRKAIEKIGGKYEGTLRSHTLMLDGHRRDTVCFSILRNEWPELEQGIFRKGE